MLKTPPHALDAEQAVLGSIFMDQKSLIQVSDLLAPDDFYDPRNKEIYEAIIELSSENKPIDLVTVHDVLKSKEKLDFAWWNPYLAELVDSTPTSTNVYTYWSIVKNKSILRSLITAWNKIVASWYDEDKDINELLEKAEKAIFWVTQTFIKDRLVHIKEILDWRYEAFSAIHEDPEEALKEIVETWFPTIDHKLWWFKKWDMIIVAARPSMWKTTLALNFANNFWTRWKKVAIFSLEMSKEQLTDKMICASMWIDAWKLQKWLLSDDEFMKIWDSLEKLAQSDIYIDDWSGWSLNEIKSKCRRLMIEKWLDVIIIDYLQLMTSWNSFNRVQEVSEISRWIKALARELKVPIIALSQLSRAVESRVDKQPVMSDLRESWSIEQDADIIMMIYREDYYDPMSENPWLTSLFFRKNRNGPTWQVDIMMEKKYQRFYEIEKDREELWQWWNEY